MGAQTSYFGATEEQPASVKIFEIARWVFVLWTVFGLLGSFQTYAQTWDERTQYPLRRVLHLGLGDAWLKATLTIPLILILRTIPFTREKWKRRLGQYVLLAMLFLLVHVSIRPFVIPFIVMSANPSVHYTFFQKVDIGVRSFTVADSYGFAMIALLFNAWLYKEQIKVREVREERLQAQLARAELQVLKMQLHPHFLFNTLNTIYNLAPQNSRKAQLMIARLSELLRLSLEHVSTETVPLQRELEFLNSYLEIEKTRFEDRLKIGFDIDPETLDAEVPNMILQPLVENSVRHGVGKKAAGGAIVISSSKAGNRLRLMVTDDGKGLSSESSGTAPGIGLANTRARLSQLYGQDFHFDLSPAIEGTKATIEIPFQTKLARPREEYVL